MLKQSLLVALVLVPLASAERIRPRDLLLTDGDTVPIIIVGGEWKTVLVFNNTNAQSVTFPLSFFNQDGPWNLKLHGLGTLSQYQVTLPALGTQRIEIDYSGDTQAGFATFQVPCSTDPGTTCGGVGGYFLLRNHNTARAQDFEVSYLPGQSISAAVQHFLFDQSDFAQMVVNLTNTCYQSFCDPTTLTLEIFDERGNRFYVNAVTVAPGEAKIVNFALLDQSTWNRVGMLRLTGVAQIVVSGHRINETGSFTPIVSYDY